MGGPIDAASEAEAYFNRESRVNAPAFGPAQIEWIRDRLTAALATDQLSQGRWVGEFESQFARMVGRAHAIAVSSGSVALEVAARALTHRRRDRGAVYPALTVPAVPSALARAGLRPVPVDVGHDFLAASGDLVERGRRAGLVTMVWTAGLMSAEAIAAAEELRSRGVPVLEDCSHAHGCSFDGTAAGTIGDVAVWSLYATKVWTCGEGGMIVLDDDEVAEWIRVYANAGKARGSLRVEVAGWNCRMTEMQAVIGLSCLQFWPELLVAREAIAQVYRTAGIPAVQHEIAGLRASWYKYTVRVADAAATIAAIHARGGRTTQRTHGPDDAGGGSFGFPMADELANGHVSLPTHRITVADAERVAAAVAAARADGCAA